MTNDAYRYHEKGPIPRPPNPALVIKASAGGGIEVTLNRFLSCGKMGNTEDWERYSLFTAEGLHFSIQGPCIYWLRYA